MKTVKFKKWECTVLFGKYAFNNHVSMILAEVGDPHLNNGPIAIATVNVPDYYLSPGEVLIKDWSENEGMMAALEAAGIVEDTGRRVVCGFAEAKVARLKEPV